VHSQVPVALGDFSRIWPGLVDGGHDRGEPGRVDRLAQAQGISNRQVQLGSQPALNGDFGQLGWQPASQGCQQEGLESQRLPNECSHYFL
jgi:hypothetical protein